MILVTGATGHLGKPLVHELLKHGEKVRVIAKDGPDIEGVDMIRGDILDHNAVNRAMEGVGTVYHLAAIVNYKSVPKKLMYSVNVNGTKNVLDNLGGRKLIYQSSTAVYGNDMRENPANEDTPYNPSNYYGETKMLAEKLVLERGGVVLRSPVIYGKGFDSGFDYVLAQIKKGKMRIIGDGKNRIQWVHINDIVHALVLAKDKGRSGNAYLIAGSEAKTQRELFALLAKELGVQAPEKSVSEGMVNLMARYKMFTAMLKGKQAKITPEEIARITSNRLFDTSKAERELGFRSKVSYEQGAKEIVQEYLARNTAT